MPIANPQPRLPSFELPAELGVEQAADLKGQFLAWRELPQLALRAGAVTRVDSAGLQLLLAFAIARRRAGLPLAWEGVSQPLARAAQLAGIREALHLPDPEHASE